MKTYIIVGASGFVGTALIKRVLKENIKVIAISDTFNNSKLPESPKITCIQSDFSDLDDLFSKLVGEEYDCFYNFAWRGVNGPEKAKYDVQIDNIKLSLKCAELAHRLNCNKYLCAGTIAERAIESLPNLNKTSGGMMYGATKTCNRVILETYCKNIDLSFVWMQFSNIYGPDNKTGNLVSYTLSQITNNEPATFGPAQQPYDFIYVDDLIEAIYRLGTGKTTKNSYFIGSGEPRVLSEYLVSIGEIAQKQHLIKIGVREDDGIKYSFDMMETNDLTADIGDYISGTFEDHIKFTIDNF